MRYYCGGFFRDGIYDNKKICWYVVTYCSIAPVPVQGCTGAVTKVECPDRTYEHLSYATLLGLNKDAFVTLLALFPVTHSIVVFARIRASFMQTHLRTDVLSKIRFYES